MKLPAYMQTAKLLEANRFAIVRRTHGPVLTTAFFKALFLYARHRQVDYIVITARRPVDRMYERLLYRDVDPEAGFIPIKHVGNVPHRVLFFPVKRAEEVWKAAGHPLYRYGFETDHPDIDVAQDTAIAEKEMLA